ncbi:cell division protein Cdc14 [Phyllosticta capitalensis]|uniref:Cell division protein Cdc14 n=1 Tax=Phyllosticta capitalensis TaxID=121624 RepID=A0ABR1YKH9_9PEZI
MEALLDLSFDNITSNDVAKIRKGLRQIEGLLAQICLSKTSDVRQKPLKALHHDPAFREFFRLQEGFEWNVATRLTACLEHLLGMRSSRYHRTHNQGPLANSGTPTPDSQNNILVVAALDLLQGILLLHPPSRSIFKQEIYMTLLLDLLDYQECSKVQSRTLLVLVTALLSHPPNTRTFEKAGGLQNITSLFKARGTPNALKLKIMEFLYFYLMPEAPPNDVASPTNVKAPRKTASGEHPPRRSSNDAQPQPHPHPSTGGPTRSTEEKQRLLGQYLSNVQDLVQDLRENAPFIGAGGGASSDSVAAAA